MLGSSATCARCSLSSLPFGTSTSHWIYIYMYRCRLRQTTRTLPHHFQRSRTSLSFRTCLRLWPCPTCLNCHRRTWWMIPTIYRARHPTTGHCMDQSMLHTLPPKLEFLEYHLSRALLENNIVAVLHCCTSCCGHWWLLRHKSKDRMPHTGTRMQSTV